MYIARCIAHVNSKIENNISTNFQSSEKAFRKKTETCVNNMECRLKSDKPWFLGEKCGFNGGGGGGGYKAIEKKASHKY